METTFELSRFDFESLWEIPTDIFLEVYPCPEDQTEAFRWLEHIRYRQGDALSSRSFWHKHLVEQIREPGAREELTVPELNERLAEAQETCSESEQLVRDAVQDFEDNGFSMADYHQESTLRLYATNQVFDGEHTY